MTVEGRRAAEILATPGMWRRAGAAGRLVGLDYGSALLASPRCDADALVHCLERGEAVVLKIAGETAEAKANG
ncbi:hypothetical protein [Chenggangzhangella methanolivorans]|uniref:Uncharacterized protein n=1 Tax=Chenggangzhangella methanolivorans TaxID=1437009 RepID=A0A9E6R7T6_9HYPH|nr:hypothetical protein [Chenggangzhangella methanolivorans]QZN99797.1 hypothetical protein K6K41_24560 [Chenggangzhangella methanolivorans]